MVGGQAIEADIQSLNNGAQIVVCTPGRLMDLLSERKQLNLAGRLKELVSYLLVCYTLNKLTNSVICRCFI